MFTQRHYRAIAAVLRANQPLDPADSCNPHRDQNIRCDHHERIVSKLMIMFIQDNPRFDGDKFFTAATRPE